MDEKKVTKISLSTFFLILAIIVIIVMGYFIYELCMKKTNENETISNLNSKVSNLENTINKLQENSSTISETTNSSVDNSTTLSESEALAILKAKFDIVEKIYFSTKEFFKVNPGEEIKNFDNTILKYGTNNLLKEIKNNLPMLVHFENGKYYFQEGGGAYGYNGFDKFENIKVTNSTITATLKTKQLGPNPNKPDDAGAWIEKNDKSSEFTLVKINDEWMIDKFTSSDFD